jgi:hypothetical protein
MKQLDDISVDVFLTYWPREEAVEAEIDKKVHRTKQPVFPSSHFQVIRDRIYFQIKDLINDT